MGFFATGHAPRQGQRTFVGGIESQIGRFVKIGTAVHMDTFRKPISHQVTQETLLSLDCRRKPRSSSVRRRWPRAISGSRCRPQPNSSRPRPAQISRIRMPCIWANFEARLVSMSTRRRKCSAAPAVEPQDTMPCGRRVPACPTGTIDKLVVAGPHAETGSSHPFGGGIESTPN
jgi:hypothetical protein